MLKQLNNHLRRFLRQSDSTASKNFSWNSGLNILNSSVEESRKIQEQELSDELLLVNLACLSIGALAIVSFDSEGGNKVLSKEFAAKDLFLSTWLTNIANTGRSIVRLCEDGFDTQAKMLVRALHERTRQAVILFYSDEDFEKWHDPDSTDNGRSVHYDLFSKKDRLNKRYHIIERSLANSRSEYDHELVNYRRSSDAFFSESVHGSGASVLLGSFAFEHNSESVNPATFGRASSASISTLSHTSFDLLYFLLVFDALLKDIHNWVPDKSCSFTLGYEAYRHTLIELSKSRLTS